MLEEIRRLISINKLVNVRHENKYFIIILCLIKVNNMHIDKIFLECSYEVQYLCIELSSISAFSCCG